MTLNFFSDLHSSHRTVTHKIVTVALLKPPHNRTSDLLRNVMGLLLDAVGAVVSRTSLDDVHLRFRNQLQNIPGCLLYTSDAADE